MRPTIPALGLKKHARAAQNEKKVPFRQLLPLSLNNHVRGTAKSSKENNCLYEMSLLFACMDEASFDNTACKKEFNEFNSCIKKFEAHRKHQKELQQIGIPTPDTVIFTDSQLTYLLRKYPTK
ncbi:small ribosomal subunit protein mS37 isoform X2 [Lasioglossum baleicum]